MIKFEVNGLSVGIKYPDELDPQLRSFFSCHDVHSDDSVREIIDVISDDENFYTIKYQNTVLWENITRDALPDLLCKEVQILLAASSVDTAVQCSAVKAHDAGVIMLGHTGCGKTSLASWLVAHGYEYLADNYLSLATSYANAHGHLNAYSPLAMPVAMYSGSDAQYFFKMEEKVMQSGGKSYLPLPKPKLDNNLIESCELILVPQYHEGAQFELIVIPPAELQFLLSQALHPSQRLTFFNAERIKAFARMRSAAYVRFGDYSQLQGNLDRFIEAYFTRKNKNILFSDFCTIWRNPDSGKSEGKQASINKTDARAKVSINGRPPKLTIGMATYDDFDGVYFTLQSLRMHHPETANDIEYIVIDNNPDGLCAEPLKYLEKKIPNYRYIPVTDRNGTAVRDYVMSEAASDYVLNLDCHVLLAPGSVARLIQYFEANPDTVDLLQGPIVWDELDLVSTHMEPDWRSGFLGTWALDERGKDPEAEPFEIPMHGLGLYACRRKVWPGYNKAFRGFGGEEGYIHEKFRQAGGKTLCLPFLRWLHRFSRPMGVPYKLSWEDRIRNYLLGAEELGISSEEMIHHFQNDLNIQTEQIVANVKTEIASFKHLNQY